MLCLFILQISSISYINTIYMAVILEYTNMWQYSLYFTITVWQNHVYIIWDIFRNFIVTILYVNCRRWSQLTVATWHHWFAWCTFKVPKLRICMYSYQAKYKCNYHATFCSLHIPHMGEYNKLMGCLDFWNYLLLGWF